MMTEMLAAILAITLALGSVGAIARLSVASERAQSARAERLSVERQAASVLSEAVGAATAPVRPEATLLLASRLPFACETAPTSGCEVFIDESGGEPRVGLLREGREVASSPIGRGRYRLLATVQQFRHGGAQRLAGSLSIVDIDDQLRPVATVQQSRRVAASCRFDPVSSVCSEGP